MEQGQEHRIARLLGDVRTGIPPLYATERDADPIVHAKLFTPWTGWTWLVTEFDGDDLLFGLVSGHEVELGYFSLSELDDLKGPGGLRVERDLHFEPQPLSRVRADLDGFRETPEEYPQRRAAGTDSDASSKPRSRFDDPLQRPSIRLVETCLADAWAEAAGDAVKAPDDAARIMQAMIGRSDREQFVALYLNARHQITHAHVVSTGTATNTQVHPREVFKAAVLANAAAVIVGHNHPSGDVAPSSDDMRVVERLKAAGDVLGIEVLDALIVGPGRHFFSADGASIGVLEKRADGASPPMPARIGQLERACAGLLQDIEEVLERVGESWWDDTVTSGLHHRECANRLLGRNLRDQLPEIDSP